MSAPLFEAPSFEALAELMPAYEFEAFIAQGGMGAVYKARQRSLDRDVAIKILPREFGDDPEFRRSFETEAKAMARLNHPNLIGVFDFGDADGMPYIVMEYVNGKSLFHSANNLAIDPVQAVTIVKGICDGLAHAHENGIIHRDIKPANILLTPKAEPKIGDFGLARPAGADHSGIIMGTPGYAAPEITRTPEHADRRSDLFALGVILYELLTGRCPPYEAHPPPPSTLCGCDPALDKICEKAMHPSAYLRYPSAEAMSAALDGWLRDGVVVAGPGRPAGLGPNSPPPVVVRRTLAGVSPAAMLLVVATISLLVGIFGWRKLQQLEKEDAAAKLAFENRKFEDARPAPEPVTEEPEPAEDEPKPVAPADENPLESLARLKSQLAAGDRDELPAGSVPLKFSDVLIVTTPMSWHAAAAFAESHGAHLAVVNEVPDLTRLAALAPRNGMWIGAGRTAAGTWASVDGFALKGNLEPEGEGDFVIIDADGNAKARPAEELHPFLIEWRRDGSNPATLAVTLRRTAESKEAGEPIYPLGTVAYEGGQPVCVVPRPATFAEAMAFAREAGGHLVVADSEEKNRWLAGRLPAAGADAGYWIGAGKQSGEWTWINGAAWDFENWQELPAGAFEGSAALVAPDGEWRHAPSGHRASGFIIEWGGGSAAPGIAEEVAAPLPPAILELETKAKGLLASYRKERDKELAANAKSFSWDLDGWLKNLSKNENASWRRDVALLKALVKGNRVPAKVTAGSGIRLSPLMIKVVKFCGEKQESIDSAFKSKAVKVRDAYAVRLAEAAKSAAGPEKKAIDQAAAQAKDLDGWLAAMGVDDGGSPAVAGAQEPLHGRWILNRVVTLQVFADGTVTNDKNGWQGTWKFTGTGSVGRTYVMSWQDGDWVDSVTLSPDFSTLDGANQQGDKFEARREPKAAEALVGAWYWGNGSLYVFDDDGSASNPAESGKWKLVAGSTTGRAYSVTWESGFVDQITLSEDLNSLEGSNNRGGAVEARRAGQ